MPCYHPLVGVPIGVRADTGKMQYKVLPYSEKYFKDEYIEGAVTIPCGNCIGCRLEYSRQWANRCLLESKYHDSCYFVTLTYNEEAVPRSWYVDERTGEANEALTLRKKDFQGFMKVLRRRFPDDHIRFFAAGEYGDNTFRPHYHAILFGLHLKDLQVYQQNLDGNLYLHSKSLQDCWDVVNSRCESKESITPLASRGMVIVADFCWETCAYVARYVVKKQKGPASAFYQMHNIEPPFSLMSRKPGIGRQYFDGHPDCYEYDYINVSTPKGGRKFRPPKYFDRLHELVAEDDSLQMKELRRQLAEEQKKAKMTQTDLPYLDMLTVEESAQQSKIKALKRSV